MSGNDVDRGPMEDISTSAEAAEAAVFPDAGVVLTGDLHHMTAEKQPLPQSMTAKPMDQKSPAEWAYERIILYIQNFEQQLDDEHEIVMGFVGGGAGTMHIQGMGFFAPDLVTFYGVDDMGTKTQMVQHVSQLNVTLKAAVKPETSAEPNRIGFALGSELDAQKR